MKILHVMPDHAYKRVYASFKDVDGVKQILAVPPKSITTNIVTEDYSDCGLKDIRVYRDPKELQNIINTEKPSVYTQTDFGAIHSKIKLPKGSKRVRLAHGVMARKMYYVAEKIGIIDEMRKKWNTMDLYCGAAEPDKFWLDNIGIKNKPIVLDTLTQLDILYNNESYKKFKNGVVNISGVKSPNKIILFFGNRVGEREDYALYNKDYFDTLFELNRLSKLNNWLILVKPKSGFKKMMSILGTMESKFSWIKEYSKKYREIQKETNLFFITTNSHGYGYFFADVILSSGSGSTVEVDAAAAKKPAVIYKPDKDEWTDPEWVDPLYSVKNNAVFVAKNVADISDCIDNAINDKMLPSRQELYLKNIGLTHDGKAYMRVINAIKGSL